MVDEVCSHPLSSLECFEPYLSPVTCLGGAILVLGIAAMTDGQRRRAALITSAGLAAAGLSLHLLKSPRPPDPYVHRVRQSVQAPEMQELLIAILEKRLPHVDANDARIAALDLRLAMNHEWDPSAQTFEAWASETLLNHRNLQMGAVLRLLHIGHLTEMVYADAAPGEQFDRSGIQHLEDTLVFTEGAVCDGRPIDDHTIPVSAELGIALREVILDILELEKAGDRVVIWRQLVEAATQDTDSLETCLTRLASHM